VPPESLGGRELVLTCRRCNSQAGHDLDIHARKQENLLQFARGGEVKTDVRLHVDGVPLNVEFDGGPDGVRLTGLKGHNSAATVVRVESLLQQAVAQGRISQLWMKIDFHADRFKPRRAWASLLRAGYLVAFAAFGYRYAFDAALNPVRAQIAAPDMETLGRFLAAVPERRAEFCRFSEPRDPVRPTFSKPFPPLT
jgi:hypothetical protein